jgi:16S rRNA (adenine1518-N6/adenine1519-N6)-dimethyltransferase
MPALMEVARAAFGQRRKMLRSTLRVVAGRMRPRDIVEAWCRDAGIDPRRRGESLSVDEFARLAQALTDREGVSP